MSTRVYLGGLSHRAKERDVEKFFRKFGRIREISMKNGFAFVEFDDYQDADDACYELNGRDLMGDRVTVEIARGTPHGRDRERWGTGGGGGRDRGRRGSPPRRGGRGGRDRPVWLDKYGPPTRTDYRVIVENLSSQVSWQDLKDYMRKAGEVTYADAHKTRRNEGCVEFATERDMKTALEKLDGADLHGRRIKLTLESARKGSRRSRSGSRSRSRSPRSRSPRSRSPRSRTRSRSRSRDRGGSDKGRSKSRSRSRSPVPKDRSRSRSRTPPRRSRSRSADKEDMDHSKRSVSRSRSRSKSRSRSASPKNEDD